MLCQTRKAATSTRTKRISPPAMTEAAEKTRSPTRTTAFGFGVTGATGWAGAVVMGLLSEERRGRRRVGCVRWCDRRGCDGRAPGRRSGGWDRRPGDQGALLDGGDGLGGLLR